MAGKFARGTRHILVVSDLHVGSMVSLMPPVVEHDEGLDSPTLYKQNRIQKWIWGKWQDMIRDVRGLGGVDMVVVNGDAVDGVNYKGKGWGLWSTHIDLQVDGAMDVLGRIPAREYLIMRGSNYHVGNNMGAEDVLASRLNLPQAYDDYILEVGGVSFHFTHVIGVSGTGMKSVTQLRRQISSALANKHEFGNVDVIVRSHAHYFTYVGDAHTLALVTPCWKARDQYVAQKGLNWNPEIGYIMFHVKGGEYTWDAHVWRLKGSIPRRVWQS